MSTLSSCQHTPPPPAYTLTVQPIIVSGDDGLNPAPARIETDLIKTFYTGADVDIEFLPAKNWTSTAARDGLATLNEIVKTAKAQDVLVGDGTIVNLFFINAVEKRPGPLGRAQQGGFITFIAMAKEAKDRGQDAFVVAHEIGHNLGLDHVVDDSEIDNKPPNIMGDGAYLDRVKPENLVEKQIRIIQNSALTILRK